MTCANAHARWFLSAPSLCAITEPIIIQPVIRSFANHATEDLFNGRDTQRARSTCPAALWKVLRRKLDLIDKAITLDDLRIPPGNRLERLQGNRFGQHSIRVNQQYRVCFTWEDKHAYEVEVTDYH